MKCISIRQPWAWLVVKGIKPVENRTWPKRPSYRGPLLVHASKQMGSCEREDWEFVWDRRMNFPEIQKMPRLKAMPRGAICGRVDLVDARLDDELAEPPTVWHHRGCLWLELRDPVEFRDPIPYRGQLGLFEVDDLNF